MRASTTPTIAAALDPYERTRADAAGSGCFSLVHRESVRDALRLVRERPVDAVLISITRCDGEASALLEQFARSFPSVPTVALMTRRQPGDVEALLRLGATGVRQVVDATDASGWRRLREVLGGQSTERTRSILAPIVQEIGTMPAGNRRFWEEIVRSAPETTTVRTLARTLSVTPSTFVSRFVRAGLPSPKDHLVAVRLCHASKLFDEGDHTISDVAYRMDYASPQSFGRHLRIVLGITPSEFRSRYPFCTVLERFLDRFVRPYRSTWKSFRPLSPGRN